MDPRPTRVFRSKTGVILWLTFWAGFAALDVARNSRHDSSTFSDCCRDVRALSPDAFDVGLFLGAALFIKHLKKCDIIPL